ncbi:MAG TPA: outer membrane beta-barrel protein [Flavisolibacter sp.]|nr:outer membrane beta-barrel protein [Flavisolibacter sp.]
MSSPKTLFFSLALFFLGQRSQAQVSLFAGPQMATAKYHIRNAKQDWSFKQGFMGGIRLTTQVEGPLYFAPSLYYSQKGYKVTFNRAAFPPDTAAKNNNTSINTIALAPLLQFDLSKDKSHFFVRFGPGIDVAISGKEKFDSSTGKSIDRSMTFGSIGYSPATAFAAFQLGFEARNGLSVFANYEHGLSNFNNADFGPMILHRVLGLSVGWKLGKR